MVKKKSGKMVIGYITALSLMLSGCTSVVGPKNQATNISSTGDKYDSVVELTAVRVFPSWVSFPEGDNLDNNVWTRIFEEKLNVKVRYLWTVSGYGEPYDQKINIGLASNDLPDILPVYTSLYEKLVQSDKLYDLQETYDKYASDRVKEIMNYSDGLALKGSMRNGKLLGIGTLPSSVPSYVLWIKDGWLKKLNLPEPRSMDDVLRIARAFANNDPDGNGKKDTWGFALDKELGNVGSFLNPYRAYDKIWVEQDGRLQFSSTLPEVKKPLSVLNTLFNEGVIDPEFAFKSDSDQVKADIISGKIGMVFGPLSAAMSSLGDSNKKDGSDWKSYPIPSSDENSVKLQQSVGVSGFLAVNKNCKYPEAVIRMLNLATEIKSGNPEWVKNNDFHTTAGGHMSFFYPIIQGLSHPEADIETAKLIQESLESGDISKFNQEQLTYMKKVKGYLDNTEDGHWGTYKIFGPNGSLSIAKNYKDNNNVLLNEAFLSETPAWTQHGANIYSRTKEFYTKAIMEGNVDSEYESYVKYFNEQGGAEATKEVNEKYKDFPRLNKKK